jgi:hypothetical protein
MKHAIILLFLLFISASLTAQQKDTTLKKGRGNLNGLVVDHRKRTFQTAVSGAQVALTRRGDTVALAKTGADGVFVMDSLAPGKYSLRISHPLFKSKRVNRIKVKRFRRTSLIHKPIVLRWRVDRFSSIGTVAVSAYEKVNNKEVPIDSVLVLIKTANDSVLQAKVTSRNGYAIFYLSNGSYTVSVTKPGFIAAGANMAYEEKAGRTIINFDLTVRNGQTIFAETYLSKGKKLKEVLLVPVKGD